MGHELCSTMTNPSCSKISKPFKKLKNSLNSTASNSIIGRYFKLEARKTTFTNEFFAATATFLTMVYIISVNATIIADSGGTCSPADCTLSPNQTVAPPDCVLKPNIGYERCLSKVKNDLITSTCLSSMIGSISMGLFANLPLALAPGMGPNAYLAYNLVGFHGTGPMSYQTALAIVLIEGVAFLVLAVVGLRAKLARLIPNTVRLACAAGIGLFIAFTGLQSHLGLGLIGPDPSNLVTVTACRGVNPETGACLEGEMQSPTFWLGVVGLLIICFAQMKGVKGSMIYGILFVTFISWFRNTSVTYFPNTPIGEASFDYFKKVVDFHPIKSVAGVISFQHFNRSEVWVALITLLYVDVLGTTGTLYTMAELGGFIDEKGEFENEYTAYMVDAGATVVGAALGVSPVAVFVESSVGIKEGGRTGLTAIFVGVYFLVALFFIPLMTSVPVWAIGGPLVMVGLMMMRVLKDIDWGNIKEAMPAFVTVLLMPLTYSISNGIIGGIGFYIALNLWDYVVGLIKWGLKMRRAVVREENQVSAAAAAPPPPGGGARDPLDEMT